MNKFIKGDMVSVNNGVKVNGTPLSELAAEVVKVADDYLFLKFPNFKYTAHKKDCRKVMQ